MEVEPGSPRKHSHRSLETDEALIVRISEELKAFTIPEISAVSEYIPEQKQRLILEIHDEIKVIVAVAVKFFSLR